ncbi:MAG TPA: hypothetical protein VMH22_05470 [bacterium]|nr:hypothetical protein [bacterium]
MKGLTWAIIALIVVGAAIGAALILQKPRDVITLSVNTSRDSVAVYEQRVKVLQARLDSIEAVLAWRGVPAGVAVRLRIGQMEEQLKALTAGLRIWRDAHDQYGVGQAYRECLLLYGSVQASCQALSYDTLPPQPDTTRPPGK